MVDRARGRQPGYGDDDPGYGESMRAPGRGEGEGVLTMVCLTCGTEYYFGSDSPPDGLECEKCGNTVFRSFYSHETEDEVAIDFQDETERDLHPDDPEGDTLPGDVLDLNQD
jgi:hypothetical protein